MTGWLGLEISWRKRYNNLGIPFSCKYRASRVLAKCNMTTNVREEAKRLMDRLPDNASWEDVMQLILDQEAIEAGIRDCEAGRIASMEEIREEFGISE